VKEAKGTGKARIDFIAGLVGKELMNQKKTRFGGRSGSRNEDESICL